MVEDQKMTWCSTGGFVMNEIRKKPPSCPVADELDRDIAHFESLSEEALDAHLAAEGIQTEETVKAVQELVKAKLDDWRDRGLLHAEALLAISLVVSAVNYLMCRSSLRISCDAATGLRDRNSHSLHAAS